MKKFLKKTPKQSPRQALFYLNTTPKEHELIYTRISFAQFIRYLAEPMENLMLINGGCDVISWENENERGLELFKGRTSIESLSLKNIYAMGNFCFVDYASDSAPQQLSEEQIAELLYMGHMFKPLHSPFFDQLQNRFAYLSHDDGFFCKIYYRDIEDIFCVLSGKIKSGLSEKPENDMPDLPPELLREIFRMSEEGVLIDFSEAERAEGSISVKLYTVGKISDMDIVLNTCAHLKETACKQSKLIFENSTYVLV